VDAEKLAKLLYFNEVPAVHVPSENVQAWRQLIEYRNTVIAKRTRAKNSCRSLLRSLGIRPPKGTDLWSRAGIRWLRALPYPTAMYEIRRDLLCEELAEFDRQVGVVEKLLTEHAQKHPGVALLQSIPGVGPRTAEAVIAYLDDPQRFRSSKAVGCYFGLIPTQDQSGPTNRLGHITRQGPSSVRRLLTEATWQAIRRSPTVKAYYQRICGDDVGRKKIAVVATAHYLVRVMWAMLRRGEFWNESVAA
jgi:transposase